MELNITNVQLEMHGVRGRLRILWGAIKNVFTGRGINIIGFMDMTVTKDLDVQISMLMKYEKLDWELHTITYNGFSEKCSTKSESLGV